MIKAVLFDIDGVLMDSFDANLAYYQKILLKLGKKEILTAEEFRTAFHLRFTEMMERLLKGTDPREVEHQMDRAREVHYPIELLKEMPGVQPVLELLKKKYALGVVSNRRQAGIDRYFEFAKTREYFTTVIGCEDVANPKPHPEPLLLAAKRLDVSPTECAYVGDAHTDIEAGLAAGMKTVLFGDAEHKGAHARARSFAEIPSILSPW